MGAKVGVANAILKIGMLFLFMGFCFPLQETEKINYATRPILNWSDFRGVPDTTSSFLAKANTGIRYNWTYSTSNQRLELSYEVEAYFFPKDSWAKSEARSYPSILAHEQLHFDITELHARKFRKALSAYKLGRNIRRDMQRMHARIVQKQRQLQLRYDQETQHHLDSVAQKRWALMISDSLQFYKEYRK